MNTRKSYWAGIALLLILPWCASAGAAQSDDPADQEIVIGWTAWADTEFVTKLAERAIEKYSDYEVTLRMANIAVQYQGVAEGSLDGMLMAWLPDTHADYWQRVKDDVDDLGPLYSGAQMGWAVPAYVPESELSSIADLNKSEVRAKLKGRIQGIDPGAGEMQISQKMLSAYDLEDYRLVASSDAAMTAALARAVKRKEWIVATVWTPHWIFGRWDLRFLDESKQMLGNPQHVDALVRKGFKTDYPEIATFVTNMNFPLDELQRAMVAAQEDGIDTAIDDYMNTHEAEIKSWFAEAG